MDISFQDFLMALQGPWIEAGVGALTSIVAEYVPKFEKLERKWKRPVMFAFNVGVPLGAAAVSIGLGYQPGDFDATIWPALVAGVLAFVGSQAMWVGSEVVKLKALLSDRD